MKTIQREIVVGLIFSKDGKIFQAMKNKGGVYFDCWHIPGGGVEKDESQKIALIREMKEEAGLDISNYPISLIDDAGTGESEKISETGEKVLCQMRFYVYKILINDKNADEIKINLSDELIKYRWTELSELKTLKLTPPSVELFTKLGYLS